MAWYLTAAFLLVTAVNCDICAREDIDDKSFHCDRKHLSGYFQCENKKSVALACVEGLSFNLKLQACVRPMMSECAGAIEDIARSEASNICNREVRADEPRSLDASGLISFRCYPKDPTRFVVCPPNTLYAAHVRCPAGMLFSLSERKCSFNVTTDCALFTDKPDSENIETATETEVGKRDEIAGSHSERENKDEGSPKKNATQSPPAGNLVMKDEVTTTVQTGNSDTTSDNNVPTASPSPDSSDAGNNKNTEESTEDEAALQVGQIRYCPQGSPPTAGCVPRYPHGPYPPNRRPVPKKAAAVCRARYSFHPEKADWEGARQICEMEGGQLAVITDETAQGRIGSRFGKLEEFWIGATDIEREGQFRWVNGQGLGFARWYSSQPSKSYPNNEHCVTFNYWGADTKWGDRNCFDSRPFLCETMVCRPARRRFPGGYPGQFRGPMRNPYQFPRNQNFPGPRGLGGISTNRLPLGRGFPYNSFQRVRTPINL